MLFYNKVWSLSFLYFLIPYCHLALAIDYQYHSLLGIFIALFIVSILGFFAGKTNYVFHLLLGNFINLILSYLIILLETKFVVAYDNSFLNISVLYSLFLIAQLISCFWGKLFRSEKKGLLK
ncbi:hypothetical protein [Enterococcus sp. AZ103]|uniref:hypothetical protein n=1 Tax=Enterococcus sp. AZ103 TaxID=2774628 RepID=UPI003F2502BD